MQRDPRVLLADVDQAAEHIVHFTESMHREAYLADARTQAAVERKFEIIGEALNFLSKVSPEIAERIPTMRVVVDFRNMLIHGYAVVIPERVWDYVVNDLPELHRIIKALLSEMDPPDV